MKTIAVIHTVHSVIDPFDALLHAHIPDLTVYHMLDEFLSIDPNRQDAFLDKHQHRLHALLRMAMDTAPDLIACTCSTLSQHIRQYRADAAVPLVPIDEAMIRQAVASGQPILILGTAQSSIAPLCCGLREAAASENLETPDIAYKVFPHAFETLQRRGRDAHDAILLSEARHITHRGIVLLSQASMAHLQAALEKTLQCPVYSAPALCVRQISEQLEETR